MLIVYFYMDTILFLGFCEMMSAYFPEFESINHSTICQWIFELAAKLETDQPQERDISAIELSLPEILPKAKPRLVKNFNGQTTSVTDSQVYRDDIYRFEKRYAT